MSKPASRSYSVHSKEAVELLGSMIRSARIDRGMTIVELAERAGISRGLVQRIELGDMACSIGTAFELAAILGIRLFGSEPEIVARHLGVMREKLTLLPKSARKPRKAAKDDF